MPEMWPPQPAWTGVARLLASGGDSGVEALGHLVELLVRARLLESSIDSIPAVIARGLPERVPAWSMGPAGATC